MYELKVIVKKVMGECTADPAMKPGDYFTISDGDIQIPDGGYICLWALQSLIPLITPKERELSEKDKDDWMCRVHHAQCPDPDGRVIFEIERTGKLDKNKKGSSVPAPAAGADNEKETSPSNDGLAALHIEVESVQGHCTSRMNPGDYATLRSGRLYVPPGRFFCLYALQAVLPFLPAKQRHLGDGDWMKEDNHVLCPDPAGNVILRIDRKE